MSDIETTPTSFSGTLPIEARTVFRLSSAIFYLIGLVITGGLVAAALYFDWPTWLQYTMYALLAIDLIYSVIDIVVFQKYNTSTPSKARCYESTACRRSRLERRPGLTTFMQSRSRSRRRFVNRLRSTPASRRRMSYDGSRPHVASAAEPRFTVTGIRGHQVVRHPTHYLVRLEQ